MLTKTINIMVILLLLIASATAGRMTASYTVPEGVSQVKVTYVKQDNTVVFEKVIPVDPESKFTIRPVR